VNWLSAAAEVMMTSPRHPGTLASLVLVLAACTAGTSSPVASPAATASIPAISSLGGATTSASSSASATPSPAPTATAAPTPVPPLPKGSLALVRVTSLNVRVAASSTAALLITSGYGQAKTPLHSGDRILVLDGPVAAGGYRWYEVGLSQDPKLTAAAVPVGWVAAGTASDPWLVADTTACPQPGVVAIGALSGIQRLACYGNRSIGFTAHQAAIAPDAGLGGTCQAPPGQPAWLVCDNINYNWVNNDGGTSWLLLLHFDPATAIAATGLAPASTTGPAYQVTGHFNDPAAQACASTTDSNAIAQASAKLTCETAFVVEKLRKIG
jgi:hypothetical protein